MTQYFRENSTQHFVIVMAESTRFDLNVSSKDKQTRLEKKRSRDFITVVCSLEGHASHQIRNRTGGIQMCRKLTGIKAG